MWLMTHRHDLECVEAGTERLLCGQEPSQCGGVRDGGPCTYPARASGLCCYCEAFEKNDAARKARANLPGARAYIKTIKHRATKAYAEAYLTYLMDGRAGLDPQEKGLSQMGVKAVRLLLASYIR